MGDISRPDVVGRVEAARLRARHFYEVAGWTDDGVEAHETVWGIETTERRYSIDLGPAG